MTGFVSYIWRVISLWAPRRQFRLSKVLNTGRFLAGKSSKEAIDATASNHVPVGQLRARAVGSQICERVIGMEVQVMSVLRDE